MKLPNWTRINDDIYEGVVKLVDTELNYFAMMVREYLASPFAGSNPAAAHNLKT